MSKHTPGPWAVERDAEGRLHVVEGDFLDIAEVGYLSGPDPKANARLIAAAPELLAALEGLKTAAKAASNVAYNLGQSHVQWPSIRQHVETLDAQIINAGRLITKAKGEQV